MGLEVGCPGDSKNKLESMDKLQCLRANRIHKELKLMSVSHHLQAQKDADAQRKKLPVHLFWDLGKLKETVSRCEWSCEPGCCPWADKSAPTNSMVPLDCHNCASHLCSKPHTFFLVAKPKSEPCKEKFLENTILA